MNFMRILVVLTQILLTNFFCNSQFNPSTYTPVPYESIKSDNSNLFRSMENQINWETRAYDRYNELLKYCNYLYTKLSQSDKEMFKPYLVKICDEIETQIKAENYESAIINTGAYLNEIRSNKQIRYRIDAFSQYCKDMESNGGFNYKLAKVNDLTYEYWLSQNQYRFDPRYNENGDLIGFKPQNVSWLYESVDWEEVYQFVTANGKDKRIVENMWDMYFFDKSSSLNQEYFVASYYYKKLKSSITNSQLNSDERNIISSAVRSLESLLLDSDGNSSFDIYVNNMKNSMMK